MTTEPRTVGRYKDRKYRRCSKCHVYLEAWEDYPFFGEGHDKTTRNRMWFCWECGQQIREALQVFAS